MEIMITPLYAAILALLYVYLSVRTLSARRRYKIAIGSGDNKDLLRRMRVHANFSEYVPIALLLIFFLEYISDNAIKIHFLAACLLAGRVIHAIGVSRSPENFRFRVLGMALTFTSLISASIGIIFVTGYKQFT